MLGAPHLQDCYGEFRISKILRQDRYKRMLTYRHKEQRISAVEERFGTSKAKMKKKGFPNLVRAMEHRYPTPTQNRNFSQITRNTQVGQNQKMFKQSTFSSQK